MKFEDILNELLSNDTKRQYAAIKELSRYEIDDEIREFFEKWLEEVELPGVIVYEIRNLLKDADTEQDSDEIVHSSHEHSISENSLLVEEEAEEEIDINDLAQAELERRKKERFKEFINRIFSPSKIVLYVVLIAVICVFAYYGPVSYHTVMGLYINKNSGNYEHLADAFEHVLNRPFPEKYRFSVCEKYFQALAQQKEYQILSDCCDYSLDNSYNSCMVMYYKGLSLYELGSVSEAKQILTDAWNTSSDSDPYSEKTGELLGRLSQFSF